MRALLLTAVNELQFTTVPDPVPSAGEVPLRAAGAEARLERGWSAATRAVSSWCEWQPRRAGFSRVRLG
ncbi:MAG: hypothetical protein NT173_01595 [Opitutales bacterium]|nr:hypothetical protein [Opitutales bacterium]